MHQYFKAYSVRGGAACSKAAGVGVTMKFMDAADWLSEVFVPHHSGSDDKTTFGIISSFVI